MAPIDYAIPAIAFVALANPAAFKIVRGVAGGWVASADGLPTLAGLILHAIVFVLIVGFIMNLQYKNKEKYRIPSWWQAPYEIGEGGPNVYHHTRYN
jgi:hypothetical protein